MMRKRRQNYPRITATVGALNYIFLNLVSEQPGILSNVSQHLYPPFKFFLLFFFKKGFVAMHNVALCFLSVAGSTLNLFRVCHVQDAGIFNICFYQHHCTTAPHSCFVFSSFIYQYWVDDNIAEASVLQTFFDPKHIFYIEKIPLRSTN